MSVARVAYVLFSLCCAATPEVFRTSAETCSLPDCTADDDTGALHLLQKAIEVAAHQGEPSDVKVTDMLRNKDAPQLLSTNKAVDNDSTHKVVGKDSTNKAFAENMSNMKLDEGSFAAMLGAMLKDATHPAHPAALQLLQKTKEVAAHQVQPSDVQVTNALHNSGATQLLGTNKAVAKDSINTAADKGSTKEASDKDITNKAFDEGSFAAMLGAMLSDATHPAHPAAVQFLQKTVEVAGHQLEPSDVKVQNASHDKDALQLVSADKAADTDSTSKAVVKAAEQGDADSFAAMLGAMMREATHPATR